MSCCRRERLASLFGQPLHPTNRATGAACCDVCALAAASPAADPAADPATATATATATGAEVGLAAAAAASVSVPVGGAARAVLRLVSELNDRAASVEGEGGAAPAKLTALKLVGEAAKLRLEELREAPNAEWRRWLLEKLVVRLVLDGSLGLHFAYSAYSINAYLVLAPTLAAQLRRGAEPAPLSALPAALELDAATAAQLPRLARAGGGASSPTTKRSRPPAGASSKRARSKPARRPPPPDADSDFEGCEAAAPAATGEVVVLDDDDDSD